MLEDLKRYTRWLGGWLAIVYFLVVLIGKSPLARDNSDPGEWGQRSGVRPRTDSLTGCQYLETAGGGITPRLRRWPPCRLQVDPPTLEMFIMNDADPPASLPSLTLTEDELIELTSYRTPAWQLRALHSRGFARAFINRLGRVVLERSHYEAVCAGAIERPRPKLRLSKTA